jgi:hypothetical protein
VGITQVIKVTSQNNYGNQVSLGLTHLVVTEGHECIHVKCLSLLSDFEGHTW